MIYKIILSKRAQFEILDITDYYFQINNELIYKFYFRLEETYNYLRTNPYFQKKYKEFRIITIKKFHYVLVYEINESNNTVHILSCFHTSQNPNKYPL
jgi:toxin ParE1/3/4